MRQPVTNMKEALASTALSSDPALQQFIPKREPILAEREATHGDFAEVARVAQDIKRVVTQAPGWVDLTDVKREALDLIATKIGRIIAGDPNHKDHWDDIAGYAKLVAERIG